MAKFDFDRMLISVGAWGNFQIMYYFCICCVVFLSVFTMSYIFVARDVKYRCKIEGCDIGQEVYNPAWLSNAVPFKDGYPSRCHYYQPESNSTCIEFNKTVILTCDTFVYERNQTTIVQDFGITCNENFWKLTIVGTLSVLGELITLPIAGFVSDRYGRKILMVVGVAFTTLMGLMRSFSDSYTMYVACEMLDTALSSGIYSAAFIMALEIVDSKRRNLGNTVISVAFALGQVLLSAATWATPSWRIMLRIIYTPGIAVAILLFFAPESARWLALKNRRKEARSVLKLMARVNGNEIDESLMNLPQHLETPKEESEIPLMKIFKCKPLLLRTINCSYIWICCNFPYYGLTMQSVALSEDIYTNFMLQAVVEVPAYLLTYFCIDKFGRRKTLSVGFLFAGIFCIIINLIQEGSWLALIIFLSGKFFITLAYTTTYIYTAEMFPTGARHSTFAICSMCGRIGSMLAPQVPLLVRVFKSLPLIIFSAMALSAGVLALFFPETHNAHLPDEFDEAVNIEEIAETSCVLDD